VKTLSRFKVTNRVGAEDIKAFSLRAVYYLTKENNDFMFQLTKDEAAQLNRSQFVTGSQKHRDPKFRPSAFQSQ